MLVTDKYILTPLQPNINVKKITFKPVYKYEKFKEYNC